MLSGNFIVFAMVTDGNRVENMSFLHVGNHNRKPEFPMSFPVWKEINIFSSVTVVLFPTRHALKRYKDNWFSVWILLYSPWNVTYYQFMNTS